ncbi:hypothetical protein EV424DRAFT_1641213 [Suillus variegatus]|nr:hypothetical protein EV424DRAFT_1641213 [Suillus variegatus]
MDSKYSVDAITAARSLQVFTFIYTSMATFWTYDYACSMREEVTDHLQDQLPILTMHPFKGIFLLYSSWNRVKMLYVVTRYVPFLLFSVHLYLNFVPNETSNHQAVIVGSMVALFTATATAPFETSAIPGITGCYQSSGSARLFVPFLLLFGLELMLISLTLTCAIRNWRTNNGSLYVVILKHNVLYYACGLFFSTVNVLTSLLLDYAYSGMFQDFQFIIHAILATRMHLHLWHADYNRDCNASDLISLSQLVLAPHIESA